MPRSLKAPKRTDCITSLHPLYPVLKCNSRGHQNETGEEVSTASVTTWEIRSRKQNKKFTFGILDQHLQTLDARKAITRANFQRLAVELPLEWMSCSASPAAVCPSGNGIRDHPSIADCRILNEFLFWIQLFSIRNSKFAFEDITP
jgi:hypothetical protein